MDTTLIVILVVLALVGYFLISLYNSLINAKNRVENSFAGIDVQLVKRYDLIPNLVAMCEKYMKHERETLLKVTEMRAKAIAGNLSDNQ